MTREPPVVVWRPGDDPARSLRAAAGAAGRADLAIVLAGVQPFGDWRERLAAAARSDTTIATASALLSDGPFAPSPLPDGEGLEDAAASVAASAARLRPRIAAPVAGCVLLRRTALDVAGLSDEPGSTAAALADFAERCTALGLGHVLADDVLAAGAPASPTAAEQDELDARYPHRAAARRDDERPESPIEHAVLVASRGLDKLSVTVDARSLGPARAGTQVHAIELIAALGRTGRVALRVVTPPDLDDEVRAAFEQIDDLELLPYERAANEPQAPTDVVHRPSQVFTAADLALLLPLGHRIVVTHQDLIAYRIPSYHESVEDWERYRRVTRDTLGAADHVVFFSEHARADALADALVDPAAASVVAIGVDHHVVGGEGRAPTRPPRLTGDAPFLLCLGADLPHKHHGFARALTEALRSEGWEGRLVLAGPGGRASAEVHAPADAEAAGRAEAGEPLHLGPVGEDEKAWLLRNAAAVVYPSLYEGFGLIPFEAAAAGTPCLFAAWTALAEVLPPIAATLVPWDPVASARAVAAAPARRPRARRPCRAAARGRRALSLGRHGRAARRPLRAGARRRRRASCAARRASAWRSRSAWTSASASAPWTGSATSPSASRSAATGSGSSAPAACSRPPTSARCSRCCHGRRCAARRRRSRGPHTGWQASCNATAETDSRLGSSAWTSARSSPRTTWRMRASSRGRLPSTTPRVAFTCS